MIATPVTPTYSAILDLIWLVMVLVVVVCCCCILLQFAPIPVNPNLHTGTHPLALVLPYSHWCRYSTYTCATCTVWWWS